MSIFDLFLAPKVAPAPAPVAIVQTFEAPAEMLAPAAVVREARPSVALDAMVAAFHDAKACGFGDREAFCDALEALREAPLLQSTGKGAARVNAKSARRLKRAIDAVRAEAFFEPAG